MKTNHEWTRSSWKSFPPKCLSSWPFTDPFGVFSNPLESLRGPPCPTFGGSFLSLLQPLRGPSPFFVALRGYLYCLFVEILSPLGDLWRIPLEPPPTPSWPFTDPFGVFSNPFVALHGPLWSLFQPLGVPSRTPLPDLWRILLEPSPTPSWPFAVLRGPSWISFCLFVEILSPLSDLWRILLEPSPTPSWPFVVLRSPSWITLFPLRGPSRTPFESFPTPWSPFADPLARPLADPS